jgi:hypothetical protein
MAPISEHSAIASLVTVLSAKRSPSITITLRTSFKYFAAGVPLRNRTSSTTRARTTLGTRAPPCPSFVYSLPGARKSRSQSVSILPMALPLPKDAVLPPGPAWRRSRYRPGMQGARVTPKSRRTSFGRPAINLMQERCARKQWTRSATGPSTAAHSPRKNSIIAALTSAGCSCWVQWPQPGRTMVLRSFGTNLERFGRSRSIPGKYITRSLSPAT